MPKHSSRKKQKVASKSRVTKPSRKTKFRFNNIVLYFFFLILILIFLSGYLAGITKPNSNIPPQDMTLPTPKTTPFKSNANYDVSFTRTNGDTYLRYKDATYTENKLTEPRAVPIPGSSNPKWETLISSPENADHTSSFDEIFNFSKIKDSNNFVFIMRWVEDVNDIYPVYYYNSTLGGNKVSKVAEFKWRDPQNKFPVPTIGDFDSSGKYVTLNMFSCWNCEGGNPETLVLNLLTGDKKDLGATSYFKWKDNGAYEFKEYKIIPCATESPTVPYHCSEDPNNLPLQTGQL